MSLYSYLILLSVKYTAVSIGYAGNLYLTLKIYFLTEGI